MNTEKLPEFTTPEENGMGEYLIPCLECESVRDQAAQRTLPAVHDCRVLRAEYVCVEGLVQAAFGVRPQVVCVPATTR